MQIQLPDNLAYFSFQFDAYRKLWEAFAIAPLGETDHWFKGLGPSAGEAVEELCSAITRGHHVGIREKATWAKGHRPVIRAELSSISLNLDL